MKIPTLIKKPGAARCLLLCLAFGAALPAFATNYYIATNGNDGWNGTSRTRGSGTTGPWRTMAHAMDDPAVGAGDTIIVLNGTYNERFNISKSGSSSANLVIKAENRRGAVIDVDYREDYGFFVTGNYVKIDGFKVFGANASGISLSNAHHITVTNCESGHNKASGIYAGRCDYLWIDRNEIYDNAWGETYPWGAPIVTSGISIHLAVNITGDTQRTTPRINIRWNKVYDNYQNPDANTRTDGAGIILDDLLCKQSQELPDYDFPALVEGNLTYSNSAPGIKLFSSDNLTIRNNTSFLNCDDDRESSWRAEIQITNCDNVNVANNIAVCDSGLNSNNTPFANVVQGRNNPNEPTRDGDNENIVWRNNLLYDYNGPARTNTNFSNASVPTAGSPNYNKINVAPGFIDASRGDGDGYDFHLTGGSAARNAGTTAYGYASTDLAGLPRFKGSKIDIGAYEYQE